MCWLRYIAAIVVLVPSFSIAKTTPTHDGWGRTSDGPLWPRRISPSHARPWRGLATPSSWPAEPTAPSDLDQGRFTAALETLCGRQPKNRVARYAHWIVRYSQLHRVDPFLVAAVIYRQGRCRNAAAPTNKKDKDGNRGIGLSRIHVRSHARQIHHGWYRYWTREDEQWHPHELLFNRFPFTRRALRRPEVSIYFTAALLYVYNRQCRSIDQVHRGEAHRHPVSHFLWGDRVLGARFEDLVLQTRRRMLDNYSNAPSTALAAYRDFPLHSPLDGAPRKISSHYNDRRDRGRRHKGVDFLSDYGEPVRSVADGVVVFAGIDHPRRGASNLGPARARRVPNRYMGRGGLFIIVDHGRGFTTGYFHLARYTVKRGDNVKGGQLIGFVGATGIKESPAHLHFEMRRHRRNFNPTSWLRPLLAPPESRKPKTTPKKPKKPKKRPAV